MATYEMEVLMCDPSNLTPDQARQLLGICKTRLFYLEQQRARLGFSTPPEVLTEIRQICDEEIPSLLARVGNATGEYVDDRVKLDIDRMSQRTEQLASEYFCIGFINREDELRTITHPLAPPFVLIEAPARYGKSFLLKRAKKDLETAGWLVCLIDFAHMPKAAEDEIGFIETVSGFLPDSARSNSLPSQMGRALSTVIGGMSRLGRPVALLCDSVEQIRSQKLANWIRDQFIYPLERSVRSVVGGRFRCIVAGRYIAQTWVDPRRKYSLGYECFREPIRLSPFTFEVILDTVERLDTMKRPSEKEQRPYLLRDAIERVARGVQMVSGGHPACLVSLLLEIDAEQDLNPPPSHFDDNRKDLFTRHVEPTCRAILRDVPLSVSDIFPYVCLFRCYNEQIVRRVLDWAGKYGKLGDNAERDASRVLQVLIQQGLVVWKPEKRFYVNDVVRRIISLQRRLDDTDRELVNDLNRTALELYEEWLDDPPLLDPVRYQAMIVEHLYHLSVCLPESSMPPNIVMQEFQNGLSQDLERFDSHFGPLLGPFERLESLEVLLANLHTDDEILTEMQSATEMDYEIALAPLVKYSRG